MNYYLKVSQLLFLRIKNGTHFTQKYILNSNAKEVLWIKANLNVSQTSYQLKIISYQYYFRQATVLNWKRLCFFERNIKY